METATRRTWELILNTGNGNEASHDCQGAEEQKQEPGFAPKAEIDSIATENKVQIADKVKWQATNTLEPI